VGTKEQEAAMQGFVRDITGIAAREEDFCRAFYTARRCQFVMMALKPKEEIGPEIHALDQFFRVEEGTGEEVLDGVRTAINAGYTDVVPAGASLNIINTGSAPLKLYTLYAPPKQLGRAVRHTRARAATRRAPRAQGHAWSV
jgi:mannose-6-phosphate isomerase-like protein (cupin superfamily)